MEITTYSRFLVLIFEWVIPIVVQLCVYAFACWETIMYTVTVYKKQCPTRGLHSWMMNTNHNHFQSSQSCFSVSLSSVRHQRRMGNERTRRPYLGPFISRSASTFLCWRRAIRMELRMDHNSKRSSILLTWVFPDHDETCIFYLFHHYNLYKDFLVLHCVYSYNSLCSCASHSPRIAYDWRSQKWWFHEASISCIRTGGDDWQWNYGPKWAHKHAQGTTLTFQRNSRIFCQLSDSGRSSWFGSSTRICHESHGIHRGPVGSSILELHECHHAHSHVDNAPAIWAAGKFSKDCWARSKDFVGAQIQSRGRNKCQSNPYSGNRDWNICWGFVTGGGELTSCWISSYVSFDLWCITATSFLTTKPSTGPSFSAGTVTKSSKRLILPRQWSSSFSECKCMGLGCVVCHQIM